MKEPEKELSQLLEIPQGLEQMNKEDIYKYYFVTDQQPDEAYICEGDVFLSLKLNKDGFTKEQLQEYKTNVFDAVFSKGTANYQSELKEALNQIYYSFETKNETPSYIKAIAALHSKRLLYINFTCPLSKKAHWEPIIIQAFNSLKNQ